MMNLACGSIQYAAPEILQTQKYMGELVDIWSVGVMLFGLVNSYLPFEDDSQRLTIVLKKILKNDYTFRPGLSSEVKDLIVKMLNVSHIVSNNSDEFRSYY